MSFRVSTFLLLRVSAFPPFCFSAFPRFRVSAFPRFRVSAFPHFFISAFPRFQGVKDSFTQLQDNHKYYISTLFNTAAVRQSKYLYVLT
jgi:hypothetical protein